MLTRRLRLRPAIALGLLTLWPQVTTAAEAGARQPAADVLTLLQACHDRAWHQPAFRHVPNAGVSVYRNMVSDDTVIAYWIVDWEQTQAAGRCTGDRRTGGLVEFMRFGE